MLIIIALAHRARHHDISQACMGLAGEIFLKPRINEVYDVQISLNGTSRNGREPYLKCLQSPNRDQSHYNLRPFIHCQSHVRVYEAA
jgi:hypothetical protein